jgi:hypothetical protein
MAVGDAPSVGNSTNDFVQSMVDRGNQGGGYDIGLGQSRLSRRLIEHYKRKGAKGGKISCGEGKYERFYLDTDSADSVYRFGHELEGTVNDLGDAIDWMLRLSIRPTAKTSAANMANYALQSFFIEVSEHGYYDTLPQRLVAEGIQVSFELLVDVLSIEITGVDAEDALREGFEAVAKARKSGITEELINQMDNYFDIAVDAIRDAAKDGKISGGRITGDGVEGLSREFGKALAKKLKAASPERKQKMLVDPVEVFDFYNELLKESGQKFKLEDDASLIHMRAKRDELVRLKAANTELEAIKTAVIKKDETTLKNVRDAAAARSRSNAI